MYKTRFVGPRPVLVRLRDGAPGLLAAALLAFANGIAMIFLFPESLKPELRRPFDWRSANVIGAFKPLFKSGEAAPLLIAWFVWQLASFVYPATWAFWCAARFGWDATAIGWSLTFVGAVMAAVLYGYLNSGEPTSLAEDAQ